MTQNEQILLHLQQGKSITPLDALNLFGCFRLGARIYEIKRMGYDVQTQNKTVGNKHVAEYSLVN